MVTENTKSAIEPAPADADPPGARADGLAAVCSILVGLSYVAVALFLFLDPARKAADDGELLAQIARDATPTRVRYGAYAAGALFAFAVIPAMGERVKAAGPSLVRWVSGLAYLSFAATALDNVRLVVLLPKLAAAYAAAGPAARGALALEKSLLALDPATLLRFGALGAWILTVSLLGKRRGAVPGGLAYAGVATAAALWITVIGFALEIKPLILGGAALGGFVLLPLWFIWTGLTLRKTIRGA